MSRLVLIVEDAAPLAANLEIALRAIPDVDVAIAATGREALEFLKRRSVDAVITDLEMPFIDGFELIERLRAEPRFRRLPIIAVSGDTHPSTPERARRLGANAFFPKPYSPVEVKTLLEELLHER